MQYIKNWGLGAKLLLQRYFILQITIVLHQALKIIE